MSEVITIRNIALDPASGILTGLRWHVELTEDACRVAQRLMSSPGTRFLESDLLATLGVPVDVCTIGRLRRCIMDVGSALSAMSSGRVRLRVPPRPEYAVQVRP